MYATIRDRAEGARAALVEQLRATTQFSNDPARIAALRDTYRGYGSFSGIAQSVSVGFFSYMFYISLIIFVLFILLVLIHFTVTPVFSFAPNQLGFISIPTMSDKQTAYTLSPASSDISANITSMCTKNYTLGFDLFLTGDFNVSDGARVLLYKATSEVLISEVTTEQPDPSVFSETDIIVWLDPIKNDLYVGTFTTHLIASNAIENLPIRKPFRITIVFSDNFIEIYKNGAIEQTLPLGINSRALTGNPPLYPPIKTVPAGALLGNLSFWPRILSSAEVRANGMPVATNTFFGTTNTKKGFMNRAT